MTTIVPPSQQDLESLVSSWPDVAFAIGYASPSFQTLKNPSGGSIFCAGSVQNQFGTAMTLDPTTPFEIGSVTKTFTATLYALLIRSQSASQTVGDYIAKGVLPIGTQFKDILLDSLVNYTSGLPFDNRSDAVDSPPYLPFPYSETGMLSYLNGTSLSPRGSGKTYTYSNLAVALMAAILGTTDRTDPSGRTYDHLMRTQVFGPLLMASMFFDKASLLDLVQGYDALTNTPMVPGHRLFPAYHGAGGIVASPGDMLNWLLFNMGLTWNNTLSPLLAQLLVPSTTVQDGDTQLGLGWFISPAVDALPATVWKDGGLPGFTSYIAFMPYESPGQKDYTSPAGVFVLANASQAYDAYMQEAAAVIAHAVLFLMQGQDPPADTSVYRTADLRRR